MLKSRPKPLSPRSVQSLPIPLGGDGNRVDNSSVESNEKDIGEGVSGSWIDLSKVGKITGQGMVAKEEAEGLTPSAKKDDVGTKSQSDLEKERSQRRGRPILYWTQRRHSHITSPYHLSSKMRIRTPKAAS